MKRLMFVAMAAFAGGDSNLGGYPTGTYACDIFCGTGERYLVQASAGLRSESHLV